MQCMYDQHRYRFGIPSGPVLKHGPRSLTCMRVNGIIKTYRRNKHDLLMGLQTILIILFFHPRVS